MGVWLEKAALWGKKVLSSYFYTRGKTACVRIWSLCRRIIFFTGHKLSFSILFRSRGTICGAPALLLCWFSAGVCTASCLVRLGSVLWLIVPSMVLSRVTWSCTCASSPAAPQPCMSLSCRELLFTLNNPPCYYHYYYHYYYCYHLPMRQSAEFY